MNASPAGQTKKDIQCSINRPEIIELADDQYRCPETDNDLYEFKSERAQRTHRDVIGEESPIDLNEYPPGSMYGKNWCEVVQKLEQNLEILRRP